MSGRRCSLTTTRFSSGRTKGGTVKTRPARLLAAIGVGGMSAVVALGVTTAIAAETTSPRTSTVYHACLQNGTLSKVGTKVAACSSRARAISWNQTGPRGPKGAPGPKGAGGRAGSPGTNGASVLTSAAAPTGTCTSGDTDIDLANGEVFTCTAAAWSDTGSSIEGPMGPSNSFYVSGTGLHIPSTMSPILSTSDLSAGSYVVNADVWLEDTSPSNTSDLAVCELTLGTATDEVEVGLLGPTSAPQNDATLSMTVAATITSVQSATVSCEGAGGSGETFAETASVTAIQSGSLSS